MAMQSDELEKLLRRAFEAEPVPDFERTWQLARSELENSTRHGFARRRILIPTAAVGAVAAVAIAVISSTTDVKEKTAPIAAERQADSASQLLSELEDPDLTIASLDGIDTDWNPQWAEDSEKDETGDEQKVEITRNTLGDGMFMSPTDFLLDLEIPQ
jgi:negative regulator of sigma E activity